MNHHDAEKGHDGRYDYEAKEGIYGESPALAGATVAQETGIGGDTHRGLKSRHIQFLYVLSILR